MELIVVNICNTNRDIGMKADLDHLMGYAYGNVLMCYHTV